MKKYFVLFVTLLLVCGCDNGQKQQIEDLQLEVSNLQKANDSLKKVNEKQQIELDHCRSDVEYYQMDPQKLFANADELYKKEDLTSLKRIQNLLNYYHPESEQCRVISGYIESIEKANQRKAEEERVKLEKEKKEAEQKRLQAVNKLKKEFDDVSEITWYKNPYFTHYNDRNYTSIYIGKGKYGKPWLRLKMSYKGDDWIFFEKAYLSYDGNTMEIPFNKYDDKKTDNSGYGVWEWIDVSVDDSILAFLRKMVKGKEVKMRLSGKYTNTRKLSSNEIKGIEDVLLGYDVLCDEQ